MTTLGVYNPIFYANEALTLLERSLGMASRVHRGFEGERNSFGLGDQINIRRPSNFTVANAPATAEGITTETVTISLDNWKEVKFKLTDKEIAYTGERIINDHIRPAAQALANSIDVQLNLLLTSGSGDQQSLGGIGPRRDMGTTTMTTADVVNLRAVLFGNGVQMDGDLHLQLGGSREADLLKLEEFTQFQGAGLEGVDAQRTGTLGRKYGVEVYANQNAGQQADMVFGTASANDNVGAMKAAEDPGATAIDIDGTTDSQTVNAGESVTILGKEYTIAVGDTSASSEVSITLAEGLAEAVPENTVCTFNDAVKTEDAGALMFHKNAFALAMAPLPMMGRELGAKVATVSDPTTGLAIRSRVYYVGNSSEVHVALDVLYGVRILNSMYAVKLMA